MKRNNLSWTNGRNVHYPTDEPNLSHVESSSQEKARPNFFKLARRFSTKIVPPRTPHWDESVRAHPSISPWVKFDEIEQSYWTKLLEFGPALNPTPSIKWP